MIVVKIVLGICVFAWMTIQDIKYSYEVKNNNWPEEQPIELSFMSDETAKILDDAGQLKTIDAQKLLNLYSDNAWDAAEVRKINNAITDSYVKITGTVSSIKEDLADGWYIKIDQIRDKTIYDRWQFLTFYFRDKEEIKKLKDIKIGEKVTIVGYCHGNVIGPEMVNCYLR